MDAVTKIQAINRGKRARREASERAAAAEQAVADAAAAAAKAKEQEQAAAAAATAAAEAEAVAAKACRSPPRHLRQHIGGECIAQKVVFWRETKVLPSKKKSCGGEI